MNNKAANSYHKLDFHIHTRISRCYEFPDTPVQDVIDAAVAVGLDGLAITDHNTVESVEEARTLGRSRGLLIFPGIELTTHAGHFLAIFDIDQPLEPLRALLARLGFTSEELGDGGIRARVASEKVLEAIAGAGGIVIGAHVERYPHGFMSEIQDRRTRQRLHNSPYLAGLEITVPQEKPLWNQGLVRHFPKRYGCIQGSDAHAPKEVGRRPFYMRLESFDLAGVRLAFQEFEERIRFPHELEPTS